VGIALEPIEDEVTGTPLKSRDGVWRGD